MVRLLVLGGTSWLGGAVAAEAVRRGCRVTCLARGTSGTVPQGATLVPADRWLPGAYEGLGEFDAAVEVSWQPELVRSALREVRAQHRVYVSSISVYDDQGQVLPAWSGPGEAGGEDYGAAKVACEEAYAEALAPDRFLIARAGLIGGYGDRSDRLGYWPARVDDATGDRTDVLVPETLDLPVQVIDVLDLAAWLVTCAVDGVRGVFDAVGPRTTLDAVLQACVTATGRSPRFVKAPTETLLAAGVRPWMGPESLPLWAPQLGELMRRNPEPAEAAGLELRSVDETVVAALRWERETGIRRKRTSGLSVAREREVLSVVLSS